MDINISRKKSFNTSGFFYRCGARGVLVEADSSSVQCLKLERSEDVILNSFIADREEKVVNEVINKQNLSESFFSQVKNDFEEDNGRERKSVNAEGISISEIIKRYLHVVPVLLIINSDNEKENMELIKSIHLENYRPLVVLAPASESHKILRNSRYTGVKEYMSALNYNEYAFTGLNSIYVDNNQIENRSSFIL